MLDADVTGMTVEAHPLGAGDRVPVRIRIFDPVGERLVRSDVIHARIEIRTDCSRLLSTLRRGVLIEQQHVRTAREWVEPSLRPASPDNVLGSALRRTLEEGRVVTQTDIEAPTLVRRGDKVSVHCVSGSLVLRVTARAMDSARRGEIIELESLEPDRRDRRRFTARVSGPGEAVASADADLSIAGQARPGG
jgi:flagella basal body P-ring formation protein FlgA